MKRLLTRRDLLASALFGATSAALSADVRRGGEVLQFPDPTTEIAVLRLTSPAYSSFLPEPPCRFVSTEGKFLVFASDRGGAFAPYRLDFKTGLAHLLFETEKLEPRSLCLDAAGKTLLFLDRGSLKEFTFSSRRIRTVAEGVQSFSLGPASPGRGGADLVWVRRGKLENGAGDTLADDVNGRCFLSPDHTRCAFTRPGEQTQLGIWDVSLASGERGNLPALLAQGTVSAPFWSPEDLSLLFLRRESQDGLERSLIREVSVPQAAEQTVSATPLFASFAPNGDASVFVGASRSKAQPHVVLLLRSPRRELTLCEHHASDAQAVSPVFSPDSRRVYFHTDREGKMAIYSVNTEQLVEPT